MRPALVGARMRMISYNMHTAERRDVYIPDNQGNFFWPNISVVGNWKYIPPLVSVLVYIIKPAGREGTGKAKTQRKRYLLLLPAPLTLVAIRDCFEHHHSLHWLLSSSSQYDHHNHHIDNDELMIITFRQTKAAAHRKIPTTRIQPI